MLLDEFPVDSLKVFEDFVVLLVKFRIAGEHLFVSLPVLEVGLAFHQMDHPFVESIFALGNFNLTVSVVFQPQLNDLITNVLTLKSVLTENDLNFHSSRLQWCHQESYFISK